MRKTHKGVELLVVLLSGVFVGLGEFVSRASAARASAPSACVLFRFRFSVWRGGQNHFLALYAFCVCARLYEICSLFLKALWPFILFVFVRVYMRFVRFF